MKSFLSLFNRISIFGMLGWLDIKQRYRRSILGPFWITVSMAIQILVIGVVFGSILGIHFSDYFPYVAIGIIFWSYISSTLNESCFVFIGAEHLIKQLHLPYLIHILRVIWRNIIILFHNLIIVPLIWLYFGREFSIQNLLTLFGLILLIANLTWLSVLIGMICARYRDFPQIISSLLLVAFNLTPVMWFPGSLPDVYKPFLITYNPFYYLLDLVRSPILYGSVNMNSFAYALLLCLIGWMFTAAIFFRFKDRIPYWL